MSDGPLSAAGKNLGPSPHDLLFMAFGAYTSITPRLYANHQKLDLEDIKVRLGHDRVHLDNCRDDCSDRASKIEQIRRRLTLRGDQ